MKTTKKYFDKTISAITLVFAVMLVVYMVVLVAVNAMAFFEMIMGLIKNVLAGIPINMPDFNSISIAFLHGIAIFIILIKAYKILMSYAQHHHVSIKYIAEIAIIAGILEVLFNTNAYSWGTLTVMTLMSVSTLAIYIWKYPTFKELDSLK